MELIYTYSTNHFQINFITKDSPNDNFSLFPLSLHVQTVDQRLIFPKGHFKKKNSNQLLLHLIFIFQSILGNKSFSQIVFFEITRNINDFCKSQLIGRGEFHNLTVMTYFIKNWVHVTLGVTILMLHYSILF